MLPSVHIQAHGTTAETQSHRDAQLQKRKSTYLLHQILIKGLKITPFCCSTSVKNDIIMLIGITALTELSEYIDF